MRSARLVPTLAVAAGLLSPAPAAWANGREAVKHPSPNGRCSININAAPRQITAGDTVVVFGQLRCRGGSSNGAASQQAIRSERARDNNIASFYLHYLTGLVHGDFGFSRSLNRPVAELLKQRLPLTLESLGLGVFGGASVGLALALLTVWWRAPGADRSA